MFLCVHVKYPKKGGEESKGSVIFVLCLNMWCGNVESLIRARKRNRIEMKNYKPEDSTIISYKDMPTMNILIINICN